MEDLISTILLIILFLLLIYDLLKNLNIVKVRGKTITKLKNKPGTDISKMIINVVLRIAYGIVLILINKKHMGKLFAILIIVILFYFVIYYFIHKRNHSKITEEGIYISGSFFKWNNIKEYKWLSEDTVEFMGKNLKFIDFDEELIIDLDKKDLAESLFKKYIFNKKRGL